MIEMRSDTFTLPTPEMLAAMTRARLGDDVYGEDPTTTELETAAAEMVGKPAACFMPSGTMANLAAMMAHAPRGAKVLVGNESEIYVYEAGGAGVCGGLIYEPVATRADGTLALADLAAGFPDDEADPQFALPALICLENTHNRADGVPLPATTSPTSPRSPPPAESPCISTVRGCSTRWWPPGSRPRRSSRTRIPSSSACPRACPRRSARSSPAMATSSAGRTGCARCWAVACARPG